MSWPFIAADAVAFLALVAIAQRWSILAAGGLVLLVAALLGCALL